MRMGVAWALTPARKCKDPYRRHQLAIDTPRSPKTGSLLSTAVVPLPHLLMADPLGEFGDGAVFLA